jgi:hypothetical protein
MISRGVIQEQITGARCMLTEIKVWYDMYRHKDISREGTIKMS